MTGRRDTDGGFRFEYNAPTLAFGRGRVGDLGSELAALDCERALVVTGQTVGSTDAVMDPVRAGLGDRLGGVFDETTPEKRLATAVEGLAAMREANADALVSLGGGSSLDVAKVIATLAASGHTPEEAGKHLADAGYIPVTGAEVPPIMTVPTTLAGADMSMLAGVTASPESGPVAEPASGGVGDPSLMPAVAVYDPDLFATTPDSVLAGSAMNGFDKGIETLYSRYATPVTDGTAIRGIRRMAAGLRAWGADPADPDALDAVVEGAVLVQYGISRPGVVTLSLVHAFGHGLRLAYGMQQGTAHAVMAPHALELLFEQVDGRRELLAEALDVADADDHADAVVEAVADVRDTIDMPARLRDVEGTAREDFPEIAEAVLEDSFMENGPEGFDPSAADIEGTLEAAW